MYAGIWRTRRGLNIENERGGEMKTQQDHIEAVESYVNGNISWFKEYLKKLNKREMLELQEVFVDYGYTLKKLIWLMS